MLKTLEELTDEIDEIASALHLNLQKALASQLWCVGEDIRMQPKLEVFITVEGGVASVDKCPDNVTVYIHDMDIAYCDGCGSNYELSVCDKCGITVCETCMDIYECECGGDLERLEDK